MSLARPATASPRGGTFAPSATAGRLQRQKTGLANKIFVVAVDGSEQSVKGLHLTAAMWTPGDIARVITVCVTSNDAPDPTAVVSLSDAQKLSPEGLLMASKHELVLRGIPSRNVTTDLIDPEDKTIAEALAAETNLLRRNAGLLILGATGKGSIRRAAGGAGLMGKVAEHVLLHCKCPIALVKTESPAIYDDGPIKSLRPSLTIVACADRSHISMSAFDAALRFCRGNDTLHVLHIETGRPDQEAPIKKYWEDVASKVSMSGSDVNVRVACVAKGNTSVVENILDFTHGCQAHLVVLGSIELVRAPSNKERTVLGSVAQAVARRATMPTCIVKNFSAI